MLLEDATVVVLFFVHRGIDREAFRSMRHLFIGDGCVGDGFQGVYPVVAYAVAELFFLTPYHACRQHILEGFADNLLLDGLAGSHLCRRVETHGYVEELLVEEGYTSFHSPCCKALVGTEAVV